MNLTLYYNETDKDHLDKSLTSKHALTGTLRAQTSIIDPVIMIEYSGTLTDSNYMYISDFGRYYFITDIVSVRTDLWEVHAHVDVLTSFKDAIRANAAVVRRQENSWNMYLDDGIFKSYQNPLIMQKNFPSGFSTQEYVLAIAGG